VAAVDVSHIAHIRAPAALRAPRAWLIWRYEPNDNPGGKPRKVPWYANGGRRARQHGTPEDLEQLTTFDAARAAAARRGFDGVGFATLAEFGITALDFDDCVKAGQVHQDIVPLLADTYAELSPSGNGVRVFLQGQLGDRKSHASKGFAFGFETFSTKGFVTFTGNVLPVVEMLGNAGEVAPISAEVMGFVRSRFKRELQALAESGEQNLDALGLTPQQLGNCLAALPDDLDYDSWLMVGMAIHHETGGSAEGFETWDSFSQLSPKYTTREYGLARWASFGKGTGPTVTARSLVHLANEHGAGIDLHAPAGPAEFEAAVAAPAPAGKSARFTPIPAGQFVQRPSPEWIVKGVLPRAGLCVLFGESGSGKSFVVLDIAMAICQGQAWRGRRVRQGRVVYVCAEGAGGFRNRVQAYAQVHGVDLADVPLDVIPDQPNLLQRDDALALARAIGPAAVVIVDTLAQTTPGANENAGEDMGKALAHCAGLHRATGALVVLVHHSGKDASKGARGWSGLRAAADAELEVLKMAGGRSLRVTKMKDGDDALAWGFGLEVVPIGIDADGDQVTSCVVTEADLPTARTLRVLGPTETIVNEVIQEMAQAQTSGIEPAAVLAESVKRLPAPEDGKRDTRKQRVKRALESLCQGDDAPYWLGDDNCITVL